MSDSVLVIHPRTAADYISTTTGTVVEVDKPGETGQTSESTTGEREEGTTVIPPVAPPVVVAMTRFFGAVDLDPERYARDFNRVATEVLQHLSADPGTRLEVHVEITATNPDGFDAARMRTVRENATTLKFTSHDFEQS